VNIRRVRRTKRARTRTSLTVNMARARKNGEEQGGARKEREWRTMYKDKIE
jgi:hypothetical protein